MAQHDHAHPQGHEGQEHHHHGAKKRRGLHRDWRAWAVVVVMLGAMAIYVMSGDESLQPRRLPTDAPPPGAAAK